TTGSVIECENQVLGERIHLSGTDVALHYRSDRVPGRRDYYTVHVPYSRVTLSPSLTQIVVQVEGAGTKMEQNFAPAPNGSADVVWDGKAAYGRLVPGPRVFRVRVGYTYPAVYVNPYQASGGSGGGGGGSFGRSGSGPFSANPTRKVFVL